VDAIGRETEKSYCNEELKKSETRVSVVVREDVSMSCRHCRESFVRVVLLNGKCFPSKGEDNVIDDISSRETKRPWKYENGGEALCFE